MRPPVDQLAEPLLVGLDQAAILLRQEQHLGVAVIQHLLERIGRRHGRQRHHAGAGPQAAHEGFQVLDRVGGEDRDLVAAADAHAGQRAGDAVDAPVEVAPGARLVLAQHRLLVGPGRGVARDADRNRDELGKLVERRLRHQGGVGAHRQPTSWARPSRRDHPPSSRRRSRLAMWATGVSPMSCAVLVASAERQAPAQKKMNLLPVWK